MMYPTERAISHADIDARDEPSEARHSCTTLAHSEPDLFAPNGTIDEKVITVDSDWNGPGDLENP